MDGREPFSKLPLTTEGLLNVLVEFLPYPKTKRVIVLDAPFVSRQANGRISLPILKNGNRVAIEPSNLRLSFRVTAKVRGLGLRFQTTRTLSQMRQ